MATQSTLPGVESNDHGIVKAWLYNNYVYDQKFAAEDSNPVPTYFSRAQFDRIYLRPMLIHFALASIPTVLMEAFGRGFESEETTSIPPPRDDPNDPDGTLSAPVGSMQYAQSEQTSDGDPMENPNNDWYTRLRGLSFSSNYEAALLEHAEAQGYNADVEDNDLTDSDPGSLVSGGLTAASSAADSSTDPSGSGSKEESDDFDIPSRIEAITRHHIDEVAVLKELSARVARQASSREMPSTTRMTASAPVEPRPVIRIWTQQMALDHALGTGPYTKQSSMSTS